MNITDQDVITAMRKYGGSFVKNLANAAEVADLNNLIKIKITWAEEWTQFKKLAETDKEKDQ